MIRARRSGDRGYFDHGWLQTRHTFSFADYYDPHNMGYRTLRVINEDRVQPGEGFGRHGHRDMEILTWVLEGGLRHGDSMGNGGIIRPGLAQRMSAGTGVIHSEMNASANEPVHFLQIWILPEEKGLEPGYEQKEFDDASLRNALRLVASHDGRDGSLTIHQDGALRIARLDEGSRVSHQIEAGRAAWLQVARGSVALNGEELAQGDGAAIEDETAIEIVAAGEAEVLVFDL